MTAKTYEAWQTENAAHLMDGTDSKRSYIRIATAGDNIEIGIQPRFGRVLGNAGPLVLGVLIRVAFIAHTKPAATEGEEGFSNDGPSSANVLPFPKLKPGAKSDAVQELKAAFPGVNWNKTSPERVSAGINFGFPFNPEHGVDFKTFLLSCDGMRRTFAVLPFEPPAGWFAQPHVITALNDYLLLTADQFELFVEPLENLTALDTAGENLAKYVQALDEAAANKGQPKTATEDGKTLH